MLEKIGEGKKKTLFQFRTSYLNYIKFFKWALYSVLSPGSKKSTFECFETYSIFPFSGTYGTVFKAKNKESQEIVALKRVRLDDDDEVVISLWLNASSLQMLFISPFFPGRSFIGPSRDLPSERTSPSQYCSSTRRSTLR